MSTFRTSGFIAYKTLTQGSRSTGLLLIAIIAFSFLNILFISGILGGLGATITSSIISTATAHIQVKPQEVPTRKNYIENQGQMRAQIETIPGVIATSRHYNLGATLSYDKEKSGKYKNISTSMVGIDVKEDGDVFDVHKRVIHGRFLTGENDDEIVLGASVAGGTTAPSDNDFGGVYIGDKIIATFPGGVRTYTIVGVVDTGIGPGNQRVYMTSKESESILAVSDSASVLSVKTDTQDEKLIAGYVHKIKTLYPNLVVKTYKEVMADIGTLLDAFDLIGFIVSAIAILVAMITMFALVYVNAVGKKKQIGILRAIGIKPEIIIYSYVLQSLFYTVCGIVLGSVIVFGVLQPYLLVHPIQLPFGGTALVLTLKEVVIAVGTLFAAGAFGGFLPSRIVTREKILKAIWG